MTMKVLLEFGGKSYRMFVWKLYKNKNLLQKKLIESKMLQIYLQKITFYGEQHS